MKKKTIRVILIIVCFVAIVVGANIASKNLLVNKVVIDITYMSEDKMLQANDVEQALVAHFGKFKGVKRKNIHTKDIEQYLNTMNFVMTSDVYLGILGKLDIKIKQSLPIAKIVCMDNKQLYLTDDALLMQQMASVAANVIVISGNILIAKTTKDTTNNPLLSNIYSLAHKIYHDNLLGGQIGQIYVNKDTLDMQPIEGDYIIRLGSFDNIDNKLRRLVTFYTEGEVSAQQWEQSEIINLSFDNQVINVKKK
ncbi:MAG: hypothetical protein LBO06_00130 [Bacteroidales bacterium]|jgi:hypothetical protein|nr:hypothetical protein [Bacteroidales bacterium]